MLFLGDGVHQLGLALDLDPITYPSEDFSQEVFRNAMVRQLDKSIPLEMIDQIFPKSDSLSFGASNE